MGGRPPVAGLRAVAVAIVLAALPCEAVLAEQISTPLPGTFAKPKAVKKVKRNVRPTLPDRNPLRPVTASTEAQPDATETAAVTSGTEPVTSETTEAAAAAVDGTAAPETSIEATETAPSGDADQAAEAADAAPSSPGEAGDTSADSTETADSSSGEDAPEPAPEAASSGDDVQTADTGTAAAPNDDANEPEEATKTTAASAGEDAPEPAETSLTAVEPPPTDPETADASVKDAADETATATETAETASAPSGAGGAAEAATTPSNNTPATGDAETAAAPKDSPDAAPQPAETPSDGEATESADAIETAATPPVSEPAQDKSAERPADAPAPVSKAEADHDGPSVTLAVLPPPEPEPASAEPAKVAAPEPADPGTAATETTPADPELPTVEAAVVAQPTPVEEEPAAVEATAAGTALEEPETAEDAESSPDGPEPLTQTAALSPPTEPAPVTPTTGAKDEQAATHEAPAPETPESQTEAVEPAASDLDTAPDADAPGAGDTAETPESDDAGEPADASEPAASDAASDTEQPAAEPEAPPAHPIVATIRERLADPDFRKEADAADLKGLEEFYGAHSGPPLWVTDTGLTPLAQALIEEIAKADEWGLDAEAFHLPPPNDLLATPNAHADDELSLSLAVLKYARFAQGGRRAPAKMSPLFDQRPEQTDARTVLTGAATATDAGAYLASLQPQHVQFKRLHAALKKAREKAEASGRDPNTDRDVQLIVINMERWRWMPRALGSYHVWNNVPEFNTRVVKGGKTIYAAKTIVGQFKYATPFFSAPMRNIVFHPDWTVPPTILKEDLAPRLQSPRGFFGNANTEILRQHDLRVSFKGEPIDPDQVDWAKANIHEYTFTQAPGPANVLGRLKFNFPNRHAIYMHDTPQPELFAERIRTLSHGCIRVNEPERLAAVLLGEDKGWSAARVQSLLAQNASTAISLNRPVPVHLTYFTAVIDEDGKIEKFGDIYGIDNRMAAALFKKPVRFEVPATPAIAEAGSAPQGRDARRPRGGGGGLDDLISGLFGN